MQIADTMALVSEDRSVDGCKCVSMLIYIKSMPYFVGLYHNYCTHEHLSTTCHSTQSFIIGKCYHHLNENVLRRHRWWKHWLKYTVCLSYNKRLCVCYVFLFITHSFAKLQRQNQLHSSYLICEAIQGTPK